MERSSVLSAAVMSVTWVGPDADELRRRWHEVDGFLRMAADDLAASSTELNEHADEQDQASRGDSTDSSLWDRLGHPDISSLLESAGSRFSDLIGIARSLAQVVAPFGAEMGNPFLAAVGPGRERSSSGGPAISDWIADTFGGDRAPSEDTPFTHKPGEDSTEESTTATGPDGDSVTQTTSEDSVKTEVTDVQRHEVPLGGDSAKATLTTEKSDTYTVETLSDGTKIYTFTERVTNSGEIGGDSKLMDLAVGKGDSTSVTYSVTVPPDTKLADALGVSPYDPSSIKPGYEISIDTSDEQSTNVDAGVDLKRLPPLRFGGESTESTGTTTQISRGEDGKLSVKSGPTESQSDDSHAGVGSKDLNFSLTRSGDSSYATLEHAEFANTPAGDDAFRDAMRTGVLPDSDSSAITERYTETRRESTKENGWNLHAGNDNGSVDHGRSNTTFASERITREYQDGRKEWDEQILPQGPDTGDWARASGGTGKETDYRVHIAPESGDDLTVIGDNYGREVDGPFELSFTERELDRARGNSGSPDNHTNIDYLAGIVAASENKSPDWAVRELHNDYNHFQPGPDGGTGSSDPAPGRLE